MHVSCESPPLLFLYVRSEMLALNKMLFKLTAADRLIICDEPTVASLPWPKVATWLLRQKSFIMNVIYPIMKKDSVLWTQTTLL